MNTKLPFLIAETAFHHEGSEEYLIRLIDSAVEMNVDAVKLHLLFDLDDYFIKEHEAYEALLGLTVESSSYTRIHDYITKTRLQPIYLCNDLESLKWVNSLDSKTVSAVEIHATGINDVFLLAEASKFSNTVILGVGGCTLDEITFAVRFLKEHKKEDIFLMHGFQNYPTNYEDVLLSRMKILKNLYNLEVGYADHTDPKEPLNEVISALPVSSGFNVIEKHFSLDVAEKRVDSQAAISIDQMNNVKELMLTFAKVYGQNALTMSESEKTYGNVGPMKKALVARRKITKGSILELNDLAYKRTNVSTPLQQASISKLIGGVANMEIALDDLITFENVDYAFKKPSFSQFKFGK